MSISESSSEDYYQIIDSFLNMNSYRQWQQVPQIIYMTFKAFLNQISIMQQKMAKNSQITTQLSLKIRQNQIAIYDLNQLNHQKQIQAPSRKQSGFKKKKSGKTSNKPHQISAIQFHNSMSKKNNDKNKSFFQSYFGEHKKVLFQNASMRDPQNSIAEGLNETMIEEVKAMAQAILEHGKFIRKEQISEIQTKYKKELQKLQIKFHKQLSTIEQLVKGKTEILQKSIINTEIKFSKKVREDQQWLFNFIEQNCVMKSQLKNIQNKSIKDAVIQKEEYVILQNYSSNLNKQQKIDKTRGILGNKKKSVKRNNSCQSIKRQKTLSNKTRKNRQHTSLTQNNEDSKQFKQFKIKILKDISERMKTEDVQRLFNTMQNQILEKYKKLGAKYTNLDKRLQQILAYNKKIYDSPQRTIIGRKNSQMESRQYQKKQYMQCAEEQIKNKGSKQQKKNDYKKLLKSLQKSLNCIESSLLNKIDKMAQKLRNQFSSGLMKKQKQIMSQFEQREKLLCQVLQENVSQINNAHSPQYLQAQNNYHKIEKALYKISQQMVLARYIYIGQNQCSDLIYWQKQTANTMTENYVWKNGKAVVTVVASGLYKIQAGLYQNLNTCRQINKKVQEDKQLSQNAYIMLNGEPISSFNMIKDLPKISSQNIQMGLRARGKIFSQPVLLPARSQISIRLTSKYYGQAYLQIQQL